MINSESFPGYRALSAFVEGLGSTAMGPVKRWDGKAKSCRNWDELRKDPELWYEDGNCLVHLYEKGQSKRGPSFKVPFKKIISKECYPLLERFLFSSGSLNFSQLERRARNRPDRMVELYIPSPSMADKTQSYAYHVATRNFFAWILQKPIVGEHLGTALVGLMHSMHEFRSETCDNVEDLTQYLEEEGYLNIVNHTNHALAMLHLAETFEISSLYIRAFAHCVGMIDRLYTSEEYEAISMNTKKLLRQSRADLDLRIYAATDKLQTLLDEELSDAHMGIPSGTRAHMERFRSFLLSFYTTRLGYYPPRAFDPNLCRSMRDEFESLIQLLVDETYLVSNVMPADALGGICTLQLLQAFDSTHGLKTLQHPLPLLPNFKQNTSRRMSWLSRPEKIRSDQRLVAHTALIKASNWKENIFNIDIVRAYRRFEEETIMSPKKADKNEKVTLVDARKVRWILVYTVYQTLCSIIDAPAEAYDAKDAPYYLAISTENLPPWRETTRPNIDRLLRRQTDYALQSYPSMNWDKPRMSGDSLRIEIKPDIDYFALTHQDENNTLGAASGTIPVPMIPQRSGSLSRALSRSSTIRRSMRRFRANSNPRPQSAIVTSSSPYHEIVVQGYGNGTNHVETRQTGQDFEAQRWTPRSAEPEWDSQSGDDDESFGQGTDSDGTLDDSIKTPSPTIPLSDVTFPEIRPLRRSRRNVVSMLLEHTKSIRPDKKTLKSEKRPISAFFTTTTSISNPNYSDPYHELVEEQRRSFFGGDYDVVNTKRHTLQTVPSEQPLFMVQDDWPEMENTFVDAQEVVISPVPHVLDDDNDVKPAWEQYADLGGLTEIK